MIPEELKRLGIAHSCYPNSGYNSKNELLACIDIPSGKGVTVDYSTLFIGSNELMKCQCGYVGCRKSILGFDQLPVIIQEKYIETDLVPGFILMKIKSLI